jgi:hypothetical protein
MHFHLLLGALAAATYAPAVDAKICLMLYQMADNNLEYYLRQDNAELTSSQVINNDNLRTWVYYDGLNSGGNALPRSYDSNGNALTSRFTGSRYYTWDKSVGNGGGLRMDVELSGEINSDQPATITNFMTHAMADCIDEGYEDLFAVFSSHGGGFAGYGGDENTRHRHLLQTNANLAGAIRSALDTTFDDSKKLSVIGFDACLMNAVGAADDFTSVADNLLASEAVEPGHGKSVKRRKRRTIRFLDLVGVLA